MNRYSKILTCLVLGLLVSAQALGKAKEVNDHYWTGVERIIAIGDLHGDYEQYIQVMRSAGLVNAKGKWTGGATHLVQTGDVPDRGADTRKIIDHLQKLKKEAKRKGGRVHTLIGNHEAMNVYGDLRYVTPGEYAAFQGKNSQQYQDLQWERWVEVMTGRDAEFFTGKDMEDLRAEWEKDYPLGWVEHRQGWIATGEYGQLVMENPVVLKVNDSLFLHGGLSAKYCKSSLQELTDAVHDDMANYSFDEPGIVDDEFGPLWYRGLATDSEPVRDDMVTAILERYGASRIVVGHTPTSGLVWPRFDGKVILNDTGIAKYYGGYDAFLEITTEGLFAHYGSERIAMPESNDGRINYLKQVVAMNPTNAHLQSRLQKLIMAGEPKTKTPEPVNAPEDMTEEEAAAAAVAEQIEAWLSPGNCQ